MLYVPIVVLSSMSFMTWFKIKILNSKRYLWPPLLISADKLSDRAVALIIKWRANKAGIDNAKLAGHSMRSGIVTSLAKKGVNENEIKKITGHRSNQMVQRYIQDAEIFDNATKLLDLWWIMKIF